MRKVLALLLSVVMALSLMVTTSLTTATSS